MKYESYEVAKREGRRRPKRCETHLSDRLDKHVATINFTDPTALVALAGEAPVSAAREAQIAMTTLNSGFNEHQIGIIGAAYASAYHMMRTDRAWEEFLKDSGWGGLSGKPKNTLRARNNMLRHVMRYVFRAEGNKARRRVRVYAGMLQDRFHKGFPPEGVVPLINRWGIENLREAGQAQRKAERQGTKNPFFDDLNDLDDDALLAPKSVSAEEAELTPAQIERFVRVLATFNADVTKYWLSRAKQD